MRNTAHPTTASVEAPTQAIACANIGPRGRKLRFLLGAMALVIGIGEGALWLATARLPWLVGATLFAGVATLCIGQAAMRTCVVLALKGKSHFDNRKVLPIADAALGQRLRRRGLGIAVLSVLVSALTATLLVLLGPAT